MKKVSFIVPTYQRIDFLFDAIYSIDTLQSSHIKIEIIIVNDDPSTDISKQVEEKFPNDDIQIFQNKKNQGPGYSRLLGLKEATGDYVVFMDDDDFYTEKNFLNKALAEFEVYSNLAVVGFNSDVFLETTGEIKKTKSLNRIGFIEGKEYLQKIAVSIDKPTSTFTSVFSKEKLITAGVEHIKMLNDIVIYLLALTVGDAVLSPDNVGCYRIHSHNITKTLSE